MEPAIAVLKDFSFHFEWPRPKVDCWYNVENSSTVVRCRVLVSDRVHVGVELPERGWRREGRVLQLQTSR